LKFSSNCPNRLLAAQWAECTSLLQHPGIFLRMCSLTHYFIEPFYKPCRNLLRLIFTNNLEAPLFCFLHCLFHLHLEPFIILDILVQLYLRLSINFRPLPILWCTSSYPSEELRTLVPQEFTILSRHFSYATNYY